MGSALLKGAVAAGAIKVEDCLLGDAYLAAAESLAADLPGARVADSNAQIAAECGLILLCVKPPDVCPMLRDLGAGGAGGEGALFLSVAAGVTLDAMEACFSPKSPRLIRAMPNTPALVGKGATAFALGNHATDDDAALAERILGAVGIVKRVPEKLLDAVTGLSGSGPAFIYTVIEALADGGVLMGLPRDAALQLAAQTVSGAAEMVLQTGEHPAKLRDMVTSPGGTTIAGLEAAESNGLRAALIQAVRAAAERSKELG